MDDAHHDMIGTLHQLIETCKNGEHGFRTAVEAVKNEALKRLFTLFANQRAQFANELQEEVRRHGGDPDTGGTPAGVMHRGLINLKSTAMGGDERSVIAECERGEDVAVTSYQEAMQSPLPAETESLIVRQYSKVKDAQDQIRALEQESDQDAPRRARRSSVV